MMMRGALLAICVCMAASATPLPVSKFVGKWLWRGVDAQAALTIRSDHSCTLERNGFDHHDSTEGEWHVTGDRLAISWQGGEKDTYTMAKHTSETVLLRFVDKVVERYSRAHLTRR